jgi:hypothetical protein
MKRLAAITFLLIAAKATAQMPMIDPSQMSGIPRPDPSVPAGTLTVRVLRGDFAHPVIGQEVTLDGPGGPRTAKVDETDHAVFSGLTVGRGAYVARAAAFGQQLESQPIELPASPGVKLMLVFKADEKEQLGQPDGVARSDERLAAGTVEVKVVDEQEKPVAAVEVVLAHATKASEKVDERRAATDGAGLARFTALPASPGDGYLATARRDGSSTAGRPFSLAGAHGRLVVIKSVRVTRDARAVHIGGTSHLIAEVKDDVVEVIENLVLVNDGEQPFDPGPGGLQIPLADGAEGAQLGPGAPAGLTVEGKLATFKGTLPPGETPLTVAFVVPQHGDAVAIRQTVPFQLDRVALVTDRLDGMAIEGEGLKLDEREMNKRPFWVVTGPPVKAGGAIDVRLAGLPHHSAAARYVAATVAALIALWGLAFSFARSRAPADRAKLEQRRAQLLANLAAVVEGGKTGAQATKQREELMARLERVYRELDDMGAR